MSSTSQKHRDFVGEPMGDKAITTVAGVGPVYGEKLAEKGYDKAYVLLGQFLLLKKDTDMFKEWLKNDMGLNKTCSESCSNCIREWCDAFL